MYLYPVTAFHSVGLIMKAVKESRSYVKTCSLALAGAYHGLSQQDQIVQSMQLFSDHIQAQLAMLY
jgi:hypothetical protein